MLTAIVLSTAFFSCSKEEEIEVPTPVVVNNPTIEKHMPLSVGNYWVYETVSIDTLGNEILSSPSDSAYVDRDTIINDKTYYIIEGDYEAKYAIGSILRNENNSVFEYLDNNTEVITFTTNNPVNIFWTFTDLNIFTYNLWVNSSKVNTSVDAGTYLCYEREMEVIPLLPNYQFGTRTAYRYYHKDIGVISNQFFFAASSSIFESRLLRYHLN